MKKNFFTLFLAGIVLISCGQKVEVTASNVILESSPMNHAPIDDVHNESRYSDSEGNEIIIQNSYPRGGPYTGPDGTQYGCGFYWSRLINKSEKELEVSLNFPAESFEFQSTDETYLKFFLPPDMITEEKLSLYNYGAKDPQTYLDNNINLSTSNDFRLGVGEEKLICIIMLFKILDQGNGGVRTGLLFDDRNLLYRVNIGDQIGPESFPAGKIEFK